jgi:hypothetical protein
MTRTARYTRRRLAFFNYQVNLICESGLPLNICGIITAYGHLAVSDKLRMTGGHHVYEKKRYRRGGTQPHVLALDCADEAIIVRYHSRNTPAGHDILWTIAYAQIDRLCRHGYAGRCKYIERAWGLSTTIDQRLFRIISRLANEFDTKALAAAGIKW